MRTPILSLLTLIAIATCWLGANQQAHGQLAQAIDDYKRDRPFQYAPCDPWSRSNLFNRQTKHSGLFYNCDGEESKRNSPYICWKTHYENDLPARIGWRQRISDTAAEVKQRIADGSCDTYPKTASCDCGSAKCTYGGCSKCAAATEQRMLARSTSPAQESSVELADSIESVYKSSSTRAELLLSELRPAVSQPAKKTVRSAGLESLDIRMHNVKR